MSDSANSFKSIQPLLKESTASAYSNKLQKIAAKPNNSKKYFEHIKRYLKKAAHVTKS